MNQEGYADPTAEKAVSNVMRDGRHTNVQDKSAAIAYLVRMMKNEANAMGFDIINRIEFRDKRTGEEYR